MYANQVESGRIYFVKLRPVMLKVPLDREDERPGVVRKGSDVLRTGQ
jgi:hypothetical protein